jgi:hypothetical protein
LREAVEKAMDPSLPFRAVPIASIMRAIEFRAKVQSVAWAIAYRLQDLIFITMDGVSEPMGLVEWDQNSDILAVAHALACFEFFRTASDGTLAKSYGVNPMVHPSGGYTQVLIWLATLIVRGAVVTDLRTILSWMSCFGELGELDEDALNKCWPEGRKLRVNSKAGQQPQRAVNVFCFWLPHGEGPTITLEWMRKKFEMHLQQFESLFFRYFKLEENSDMPAELLSASYLAANITDRRYSAAW